MLQKIQLLQAGDVELNPGPDPEGLYACDYIISLLNNIIYFLQ